MFFLICGQNHPFFLKKREIKNKSVFFKGEKDEKYRFLRNEKNI